MRLTPLDLRHLASRERATAGVLSSLQAMRFEWPQRQFGAEAHDRNRTSLQGAQDARTTSRGRLGDARMTDGTEIELRVFEGGADGSESNVEIEIHGSMTSSPPASG